MQNGGGGGADTPETLDGLQDNEDLFTLCKRDRQTNKDSFVYAGPM